MGHISAYRDDLWKLVKGVVQAERGTSCLAHKKQDCMFLLFVSEQTT